MKLKVKDNPGLVRDSRSKAIISEDKDAFEAYVREKNFRSQFQQQRDEINTLKQDIHAIKTLLESLVRDK